MRKTHFQVLHPHHRLLGVHMPDLAGKREEVVEGEEVAAAAAGIDVITIIITTTTTHVVSRSTHPRCHPCMVLLLAAVVVVGVWERTT